MSKRKLFEFSDLQRIRRSILNGHHAVVPQKDLSELIRGVECLWQQVALLQAEVAALKGAA